MANKGYVTVGLPPVLPTLKEELEKYLSPEELPIHDPIASYKWFPRTPNPSRLFSVTVNPPSTSLQVERDPATGEITGLREVWNKDAGSTAKNSFSMGRATGPADEVVRGSSTNFPFWPGGIPEPDLGKASIKEEFKLDFSNLLTKSPLLSRGMVFETPVEEVMVDKPKEEESKELVVSISDILKLDDNDLNLFNDKEDKTSSKALKLTLEDLNDDDASMVKTFTIEEAPAPPKKKEFILNITDNKSKVHLERREKSTEWAEHIDVNEPVDDFSSQIPNPACTYPFELDTFQKQAILHLEKRNCVFVAAHTSAGKTVVAEYAVALTLRNMTRAIYTSPIKALSNQKYKDFKVKFDDVGLLTGDIQINPKASCLIMTTEILQSMLYNGSDLIRDLEWVIFDEVHYINNAERGHVWEEVLIMLPATVNIVLLSATVPNTIEFADWIGRIKKRKIYVISTTKRPVPLEHFLYTGTGGKTKDDRFLLVDATGNFMIKGYNDALASKTEKKKGQQQQGPKQGRQFIGEKQEKNMWIGLIDHLSRRELLPIVAFTLSKKRCDSNATALLSQDLTTSREKGEIHQFIKRCTEKLPKSDRELPQVIYMKNLLSKGIGVHHSGILPILKEVVEMLFSKGLVKLLFATETFAMGVNMPARCVVFDSVRKHDGTAFRDLAPSEYIQMAGRAGRRGLDSTGTVIILCKVDVPEMSDLHRMMLGKPTKLESQFKLTYSMILNILRVESLSVQDMLKRSFSEASMMRNQSKYETELTEFEEKLGHEPEFECMMCQDIDVYYATTKEYNEQRKHVYQFIPGFAGGLKVLTPGRVVMISYQQYQFYLACILKVDPKDKTKLTVFILKDSNANKTLTDDEIKVKECLTATQEKFDVLQEIVDHAYMEITVQNLVVITNKNLKIDGEKVIDNIKKRQIPRFKSDPPSQSCNDLLKSMQRLNESNGEGLTYLNLISDLGIKEIDAVTQIQKLESLRNKAYELTCLECTQFKEHFGMTYTKLNIREKIGRLKFLMSEEALQLHPEYQMKIEVLKSLGYIQDNLALTLKGRVACEMGNHELTITELVVDNLLTDKPVEITSALLSCMVFQQRHCSDPSITSELKKGIDEFKNVARRIGETQRDCGLKEAVGDFVDQYNFGLVEVVYQWASGMSFKTIMELTDVQEGITVKAIQRLDEVLKDVRNAGRITGDVRLQEKMMEASTAIKRDIVFTPSLYTQ